MNVHIIKIGGHIIDDADALAAFLDQLSEIKEPFILVHGGGKSASELSKKLGIEPKMIDGRRITDEASLKVVCMMYAGLINKTIVAALQARKLNAIGLSGADANIIPAIKRKHPEIDYGFVGDVLYEQINAPILLSLLHESVLPVFCALTHDTKGQMLNTNADTIATSLAMALSAHIEVNLYLCFEKNGVLTDIEDDSSFIAELDQKVYEEMLVNNSIHSGMKPKLENAFQAIATGVNQVYICKADNVGALINGEHQIGTRIGTSKIK